MNTILSNNLIQDGCFGESGKLGFVLTPIKKNYFSFIEVSYENESIEITISCKKIPLSAGPHIVLERNNPTTYLIVDVVGNVVSVKNGKLIKESRVEDGAGIRNLQKIDHQILACGGMHSIYERKSNAGWENLSLRNSLDIIAKIQKANSSGNDDLFSHLMESNGLLGISKINPTEYLAVGDMGTLLISKDKIWTTIDFPSNVGLNTIANNESGEIFITDALGNLWCGMTDKWELIFEAKKRMRFRDSVWFEDRLWCAGRDGMQILEENELKDCTEVKINPVPESIARVANRIDVSEDKKKMLVCGNRGAAIYDGNDWHLLY
ncbi:MAG: hypothetical protein MUF42_17635 [Cytophagaceae bacterium]|nr:hypothetical protein [Cytophagaceae bacterium]